MAKEIAGQSSWDWVPKITFSDGRHLACSLVTKNCSTDVDGENPLPLRLLFQNSCDGSWAPGLRLFSYRQAPVTGLLHPQRRADLIDAFRAYRGAGRGPETLIEDVRTWRSRRAERAWEKRDLLYPLLDGTDSETVKRKARNSVHEDMKQVLSEPIPRVSAGSFREFALRYGRAAVRQQEAFEKKTFTGPRGYSDCGRADMWAEEIETKCVQALEYRRGAIYLEKR